MNSPKVQDRGLETMLCMVGTGLKSVEKHLIFPDPEKSGSCACASWIF